jgi:RND superfamily putative drug exporter
MRKGESGPSTLPNHLEVKQGFDILEREFKVGTIARSAIVVDGNVSSPAVQGAVDKLKAALAADSDFYADQATYRTNAARDLGLLLVPMAGDPNGEQAESAVRRLRAQLIPQAFAGVPAQALVTGGTASDIDFFDMTDEYMPIVFVFVLALSFVLLTIVFRSLVVPVKAILMNMLSVGAAYGLLVLVFQRGIGAGVLGFQQSESIEAWIPLFLFSVLFGLSMDYHVFLLSRIRERFDRTGDNDEAVAFGIRTTAGIITGAALIMVAVFAGFASGELVMFQQVSFGLGVAVLLDATLVRSVLVPSAMKLLGARNWYLPSWLRWLPDVRVEGKDPP